jgi:hypothetical protein
VKLSQCANGNELRLWAESGLFKQRESEIMSIEFIILIVVLVVLFGGGGGYYWSRRGG